MLTLRTLGTQFKHDDETHIDSLQLEANGNVL